MTDTIAAGFLKILQNFQSSIFREHLYVIVFALNNNLSNIIKNLDIPKFKPSEKFISKLFSNI